MEKERVEKPQSTTHPAEEQEVCRKEGEKEERGETKPQPSQLCRKLYLSKAERVSS